jgi:hypothetical protein
MDFLRKILEFFTKASDEHPFGAMNFEAEEEEMIITIHPRSDRYVGV